MPQEIDEVRRQTMRGRIARQFRGKGIKPVAGRRLHQILDAGAWDMGGTVALANELIDRRHGLAELNVHDTRMPRHESQEARGLGHAGQDQPTALAFGK